MNLFIYFFLIVNFDHITTKIEKTKHYVQLIKDSQKLKFKENRL